MKINMNLNNTNFAGKFRIAKIEVARMNPVQKMTLERQKDDLKDEFLVEGSSVTKNNKFYFYEIKDEKVDKFKILLSNFRIKYKQL